MTAGLGADAAAFAAIAVLGGLVWVAGSAALGPAPAVERVGVGILCLAAAAWLVMLQPLAGVSVVGAPWVGVHFNGGALTRPQENATFDRDVRRKPRGDSP